MSSRSTGRPVPPLLAPDEPPPFRIVRAEGRTPLLLVCEHASSRVPWALGDLGLPAEERERHIGWDIGAAAVTEALADLLDAPAVLANYSRLVVDLNRTTDDRTLMPAVSDGTEVPANAALTAAERRRRLDALYHPFHAAVTARMSAIRAAGGMPALIGVHSFTPLLREAGRRGETPRPWHVGVLWNRDGRIALPLLEALRAPGGAVGDLIQGGLAQGGLAQGGLTVGDNEPYSGRTGHGHTARFHAEAHGLPWAMLEIRQDLIADAAGAQAWAGLLARLLRPILCRPDPWSPASR